MWVWGSLAILAGVCVAGTIAATVRRSKASQHPPTERHRCEAFKPIGDGAFACVECGAVIGDAGDLP